MTRRAANTRSERRGAKGGIESYSISAKHYDAAYALKQDLVDLPFYLDLAKRHGGPVLEPAAFNFLVHPLLGLGSLTLLLGAIILIAAVFELVAYFRSRRTSGSGWLLMKALITLLLGGLIYFHWPSSSV